MKVLKKKFEHKKPARSSGGFASKYDWGLLLSGKTVGLEAGADYELVGKSKDGKDFDRTDALIVTIKKHGFDADKVVQITKIAAGESDSDGNVYATGGLVITARPMTEEEKTDREARLAERRAAKVTEGDNGQVEQHEAEPLP